MKPEGSLPHSQVPATSLSWASSIQSITPHPTSWRSVFLYSSHPRLGFQSGLLSLRFPHQSPVYASFLPIRATCPAHLIFLNFINRTILGDTTAWRVLRLRMEERPPIWRVDGNILNKQWRTVDKGWSSSLGVVRLSNNCSSWKLALLQNTNFKKINN